MLSSREPALKDLEHSQPDHPVKMRNYVLERARRDNHSIKRLWISINLSSSLSRGHERREVIPLETLPGWPEEDRDGKVKEGCWTYGFHRTGH